MARQKKEDANETFEARFARLQEVVRTLESGALPLDQGVALFKEGMALSSACREQLDKARHEITILTKDGPMPYQPLPETAEDEDADDERRDA